MTFEVYSPEEVRASYNRAADKACQLSILADLTCSSEAELAKFLGVPLPHPKRSRMPADKAMELYLQKMSDRQIADTLGVTRQAVYAWRVYRDLPPFFEKPSDQARMDAYKRGLTDRQAADELGMSKSAYTEWRKKRGLMSNYKRR